MLRPKILMQISLFQVATDSVCILLILSVFKDPLIK